MNFTLLLSLLGIALLDSINPSAIFVTIAQLTTGKKPVARCLAYILGIFITYLTIGIALYFLYLSFGSSFKIDFSSLTNFIDTPPAWAFYFQFIIGLALVIYALYYFRQKTKVKQNPSIENNKNSLFASFLLGITITGAEASTALPYFGAISTLYVSNLGFLKGLVLLIIYNLIFVLPPLLLVIIYKMFSSKFESILSKIESVSLKYSYPVLRYGFIILGVGLCLESVLQIVNFL